MMSFGKTYLRLEIDGRTGRGRCRVLADGSTDADVSAAVDCGAVVVDLWSNYSRELTERFGRMFPPALLDRYGLPREVTEHHLLMELYRPHAFPLLLAEKLSSDFTARHTALPTTPSALTRESVLSLPPTAGDPHRLAALIESRLQAPTAIRGGIRDLISRVKASTGFAIGVTAACLGGLDLNLAFRTSKVRGGPPTLAGNLFVAFAGDGAHTRHIWEEVHKTPEGTAPPMVLVLGHKRLEKRFRLRVEETGGRVIHLMSARDLGASIAALGHSWHHLMRLHRSGERDLGINLQLGFYVRAGVWFLRGMMHDRFLRRSVMAQPRGTVAVFGLIAHADSRLADFALRQRGAKTVHWLHGMVEDALHYRANSTVCLCQNEVDAELRRRHGAYGDCLVYPEGRSEVLPVEVGHSACETGSGALVITNLIHPDNRFAAYGAATTLDEVLRMTANCFRGMQIPTFTWRPHPKESAAPNFGRFKRLAIDLGFRVDNSPPLGEQIKSHRHVVSTFSGSIGDVADAGAVPAIFAGLPYETEGHWGRLPEALKFRTGPELAAVLARLTDCDWSTAQRNTLLQQYNRPRAKPTDARLLMDALHSAVASSRPSKAGPEIDLSTAPGIWVSGEPL